MGLMEEGEGGGEERREAVWENMSICIRQSETTCTQNCSAVCLSFLIV